MKSCTGAGIESGGAEQLGTVITIGAIANEFVLVQNRFERRMGPREGSSATHRHACEPGERFQQGEERRLDGRDP